MITIDTSDIERALRIARMTAKCDCQEKGGDVKNHFATILCDNQSRLQQENAELREALFGLIDCKGILTSDKECVIRAKQLLNKNDN